MILEGVRAGLGVQPGLEVISIDRPPYLLEKVIAELSPSVLIFDISVTLPDLPGSLLQRTSFLLIGIDPETHQALVWTGRPTAAIKAADLMDIIQNQQRSAA